MDSRLSGLDLEAMWDFFDSHVDDYGQHWPLADLFEGESVYIQATHDNINNFDANGNYLEPDPDSWMLDNDEPIVVRTVLMVRGVEPLESSSSSIFPGCHGNIRHCIESDDLARFLIEFLDANGSREILEKIKNYPGKSLVQTSEQLSHSETTSNEKTLTTVITRDVQIAQLDEEDSEFENWGDFLNYLQNQLNTSIADLKAASQVNRIIDYECESTSLWNTVRFKLTLDYNYKDLEVECMSMESARDSMSRLKWHFRGDIDYDKFSSAWETVWRIYESETTEVPIRELSFKELPSSFWGDDCYS